MKYLPHNVLLCLLLSAFLGVTAQQDGQSKGGKIGAVKKDTASGDTYALIIGISDYKYIAGLKYADDDARAFAAYLNSKGAGAVPASHIRLLLNEEATQAAIQVRGLEWLSSLPLRQQDNVYIYFSGHGDARNADQYFLLAADCAPSGDKDNYLVTGVVDVANLKSFIEKFSRRGINVYLITDACRTNEVPGGEQGTKIFTRGIIEKPAGEIMMISTGMNGISVESSSYGGGHGLFTYYLLNGLLAYADADNGVSNHNGNVDLYELSTYVMQQAAIENRTKGFRQYPKFCCEENYNTAISRVDQNYLAEAEKHLDLIQALDQLLAAGVTRRGTPTTTATIRRNIRKNLEQALDELHIAGRAETALQYFEKFRRHSKDPSAVQELQEQLVTAYLNTSQGKLNLYLAGLDRSGRILGFRNSPDFFPERWTGFARMASVSFSNAFVCQQLAMQLMPNFGNDRNNQARLRFLGLMRALETALQEKDSILRKNQLLDTEIQIQQAIQADTAFAACYNLLGWVQDISGADSAIAAYRIAHRLAPVWPYPLNNAGSYFQDRKQWDSALYYYDAALRLDSLYLTAWYNKGLVFKKTFQTDRATAVFRNLVRLDPGQPAVYMQLGDLYQKKDPDTALFWFRKGSEQDPGNGDFPYEMGKCYEQKGDTAAALLLYKKALQLNPADSFSAYRCFYLHFYSGGFREAYRFADKQARLQLAKATPYYDKACAASWQGWKNRGFRALRQAIAAGYNNKRYMQEDEDLNFLRLHSKRFNRLMKHLPD